MNLYPLLKIVDRAFLFDNSTNTNFKLIAEYTEEKLFIKVDTHEIPSWFYEYVINYF